jgi:hypothetical protein
MKKDPDALDDLIVRTRVAHELVSSIKNPRIRPNQQ